MFLDTTLIRELCDDVIKAKAEQGHVVAGLTERLAEVPDSLDALASFAHSLRDLPLRDDWPWVEPDDLAGIRAECDPGRATGALVADIDLEDVCRRVEAGFLASVCGCVLGKPIEVMPDLADLRRAGLQTGEWPIRDYLSEGFLDALGKRHESWPQTVRERIAFVAPDDDINYTLIGMLVLEQSGIGFTRADLKELWIRQLPLYACWGPERVQLLKAGLESITRHRGRDMDEWVEVLNPRDELCGALIRGDAYGYACAGRPELAAELAWRDAGWTHRRTGVYGCMFVAAAMACAAVLRDPLEIMRTAIRYIPQRSRLAAILSDSLEQVATAGDWDEGYQRIHQRYGEYGHCRVYQECGTLINTLRFARDVGDGICLQVMQGNDTDSFGATAGSLLGLYFGPGHLEERWLRPFHDELHTNLGGFHERSLSTVARRMGSLPRLVSEELAGHLTVASQQRDDIAVLDQ